MIDGAELLRFLAAFAVIGVVLFAFATIARRGVRMTAFIRGRRIVEVVETTALANASALHVVKVGGDYLLIGRTNGAISLLGNVAPDAVRVGDAAVTRAAEVPATVTAALRRWGRA